jgi:hypothetical protein
MEKIQFKAIYGIAVEKSSCSEYVLQQRLLKRLKSQQDKLKQTYEARWQEVWGNIEDRVLVMEREELEEGMEILDKTDILGFKKEMQNVINRKRYSTYEVYKKKKNVMLESIKL